MNTHIAPPQAAAPPSKNRHGAHTVIEQVKGDRQPLTPPDYVNDASINLSENSVKVLEKPTRAAPALAGGRLFARDSTRLVCVKLK